MMKKALVSLPAAATLLCLALAFSSSSCAGNSGRGEPVTLIEGFESANEYLDVYADNDSIDEPADIAIRGMDFVPGKAGNALKIEFDIVQDLWKNVVITVNKKVPMNWTGQNDLAIALKGDYEDSEDAQSVTVALNMLNGALYYQSLTVTKEWNTFHLKLDEEGSEWSSDGPNWGARDSFTLNEIAYIRLFVSPPKTGHYNIWVDGIEVSGAPIAEYVDAHKPVTNEFTVIPYSIAQAIDDMGWRTWENRRPEVSNYRKLIEGDKATLADYQTVVNVGKNAGTRIATAWVLSDLDRENACAKPEYNTPVAEYDMTSEGLAWDSKDSVTAEDAKIMDVPRKNAAYMEFAMHGVSHEHFKGGEEQRAEYAHIDEGNPGTAESWGWADMTNKADCYRDILRQWFTEDEIDMPVAEVPPAHAFYWKEGATDTTGALLSKYGVKYINGGLTVSTPVKDGYLIDNGVLFVNRAYGANWDWVGATMWEGFWNDYNAPYYPSDKYGWAEAHFPNFWTAEKKWTDYLVGINDSQIRFLAKNSAQNSWQYLYHKFGAFGGSKGNYSIDLSKVDPEAYKYDLLGTMVLKAHVGDANVESAALDNGASVFGYWKDSFGYAYLLIGKNGNPQGRLDRETYRMKTEIGSGTLASYVDMTGATYNVAAFVPEAHKAILKVEMYGTQQVKVKLPFRAGRVASDNPKLTVDGWKIADGFLVMTVTGKKLTGETGTISIAE